MLGYKLLGLLGLIVGIYLINRLIVALVPLPDQADGRVALYAHEWRVTAVWCMLVAAFIAAIAPFARPDQRLAAWVSVALCLLIGVGLGLEMFRTRISYDDLAITVRSPWGTTRIIPWLALQSMRFSNTNQQFVIETTGYGRLRISVLLLGSGELAAAIHERLYGPLAED